jgi:hypothetical protein
MSYLDYQKKIDKLKRKLKGKISCSLSYFYEIINYLILFLHYLPIFIFSKHLFVEFSTENNFSFEYVLFVVANIFSVLFIEWQKGKKSALVNRFLFC